MKRRIALIVAFTLAAPLALAQQEEPRIELTWENAGTAVTVLIRNATVWTQDEQGVLEGADLLMRDGRIVAVGAGLEAPEGAVVVDATGRHVTPGIIDAHSHTGSFGINEGSENVTAQVRSQDTLNPEQLNIYQQLAGGTTAAQILHGSANAIGGQSAIVKWRYKAFDSYDMLVEGAMPTIKFALGENPKRSAFSLPLPGIPRRYPATRMGVANSIRRAFLQARDYQSEWAAYEAMSAAEQARVVPPRRDLQMDALVEILEGRRQVHSHSYRQDEIIMLMRVAEEMGFKVQTFQHILEGYKASLEMAAHGASASTFADWYSYKFEVWDAIPYNGAIMHDDGVVVSFNSDSGELARHLNLDAAKAVRYGGLSEPDALAFVTSNPARQLMLFDRMGSLTAGKDADVVLWNGHPLSVYSRVDTTWVDGRVVFDRGMDLAMRETRAAEKARLVAAVRGDDADDDTAEAEPGADAEGADDTVEPYRFADTAAREYVSSPHAQGNVTAIVGAMVHTVSGDVIDNGVVVFANGTITAVGGPDTPVPAEAERIDAAGRHLFPGMISMDSTLGLAEVDSVPGTIDTSEIDEVNSDLRAEVAVNQSSEHIAINRANGVTHALTAPRGGMVTGASALLRLDGWSWEEMTALSLAGMHMNFPSGPSGFAAFFGPPASDDDLLRQRREALGKVDEWIAATKAYARAKQAEAAGGERHDHDVKLAGMMPVVAGQVPLYIHTNGARDIRAALEWAAGHELRIVIVDRGDTWRAAEELAAANVPVVISRVMALPMYDDDPYDAMYSNASELAAAGVRFAIADGDGSNGGDDRNLPFQAGVASGFGLDREAALRSVTLSAAEILGVDGSLGSIDVGKSATFVLADGDLLEIRTNVLGVWIDGHDTGVESKHTRLWRQWRDRPMPGAR
jgi:imidazolonepropionase-like amidohydrolase